MCMTGTGAERSSRGGRTAPTRLEDVVDPDALERQIAERLITRRRLEGTPIVVLNYTARAASKRIWTTETRRCRGLVVDEASGEVLARPFEKFFDLGQTAVPFGGPMEASEKFDGSLGVLYRGADGKPAITTRGDPGSWQARAATELLRQRYGDTAPPEGVTWLFEIILPENRVVVDYGERRDLVALAAIDVATGRDLGVPGDWPGPRAERFDVSGGRLGALLASMEREGNHEGLVVHWPADGLRAKVKLPEYVALHRLTFATSTRTIWEALADGRDPLAALDATAMPDGLRAFVSRHARALRERHDALVRDAVAFVEGLADEVRAERRLAAAAIKEHCEHPGLGFLALDDETGALDAAAWRAVRPATAEFFAREDEASG